MALGIQGIFYTNNLCFCVKVSLGGPFVAPIVISSGQDFRRVVNPHSQIVQGIVRGSIGSTSKVMMMVSFYWLHEGDSVCESSLLESGHGGSQLNCRLVLCWDGRNVCQKFFGSVG